MTKGYPFLSIKPGTLDDTDRAAASPWVGAGHYSSEFPRGRLVGRGAGGLVRLLGRAYSDWCCRRRRAAAIRELQKLDDRMLEDIGLTRGEITAALDGQLDGGGDQQGAAKLSRRALERGRA